MKAFRDAAVLDSDDLAHEAVRAQTTGNEARVERIIADHLSRHPHDVQLLHHRALLLRVLDRRSEAIEMLVRARSVSPGDPKLAHAHAHISLEAGRPATDLFTEAVRLAPGSTDTRLGLASSRLADNAGDLAIDELESLLAVNPGWFGGHRQFAQLATIAGRAHRAFATIDRAVAAFPDSIDLHGLKIDLLLDAGRNAEALACCVAALGVLEDEPEFLLRKAVAQDELLKLSLSSVLFEALGRPETVTAAVRHVRHFIRTGQFERATLEIERWLDEQNGEMWPYAALVWRLSGDPRAEWLEGQQGQIQVIDLPPDQIDLASITGELRLLHENGGRFLDQSIRNGTQTNGPLLARETPSIVSLRERLRQEVKSYIAKLAPAATRHPHLAMRRDRDVRFAGSWSVNLTGAGYHEAHHHPTGWISGVFYVTVPTLCGDGEGNLEIAGSPSVLNALLQPRRAIRPQPGRLVLFPSFMWHATTPFLRGCRTTIAFDVARPVVAD